MRQVDQLVSDDYLRFDTKIGGPGLVVEIDESKFGKRKYNKGHRVEGCWVFGGVERGTGRFFAVPVPNRKKTTLKAIIEHYIAPGTFIISDCYSSYKWLEADNQTTYDYDCVNHSVEYVKKYQGRNFPPRHHIPNHVRVAIHTNQIEGLWRILKTGIPKKNLESTEGLKDRLGSLFR